MKNVKPLLFILLMITLFITACGTSGGSGDANNGTETGDKEIEQDINNEEVVPEETNKENDQPSNVETNDEGESRDLEKNIEYTVNEETTEETAILKTSDNQLYSMYVLPKYELTAEEPNKDVVMLSENDSIFMRIELLSDSPNWNSIEENTRAQLAAVNTDVQELSAPNDEFFNEASVYSATANGEKVTTYLIKNENLPLKLTLFMKEAEDYTDPFLKMAKTIEKQ